MPEAEIAFTPGVFQKFRTTVLIHLGGATPPCDLPPNQVVEFDGTILKYAGKDHNVPGVQGCTKNGWMVPEANKTATYKPQAAGVTVRPALNAAQEKGNKTMVLETNSDQAEAGTIKAFQDKRDKINAGLKVNPPVARAPVATPAKVSSNEEGPIKRKDGVIIVEADPDTYHEVDYNLPKAKPLHSAADQDDHKPIARLSSPAVKTTLLSDSRAADAEIRSLDPVNGKPGRPKVTKVAAAPVAPPPVEELDGLLIPSEGDNEIFLGDETEANEGEAPVAAAPATFTWDKSGHWRDRVKIAVDQYGNNPAALEQIYAQESESVVKNIKSQLARK